MTWKLAALNPCISPSKREKRNIKTLDSASRGAIFSAVFSAVFIM